MMHAEHVSFIEKENRGQTSGRASASTTTATTTTTTAAAAALQQQYQYHHFNSFVKDDEETTTRKTTQTRCPNQDNNNNNDKEGGQQLDWIEKTATIQQALATLITKTSCRLCHVYTDKQLEYENRQEAALTTAASARNSLLYTPFASGPGAGNGGSALLEVERYRQFLFDEESVVGRVEVDDEEEEDTTSTRPEHAEQQPQLLVHPLQQQLPTSSSPPDDDDDGQGTVVTQE
jgi:hypothetical protein